MNISLVLCLVSLIIMSPVVTHAQVDSVPRQPNIVFIFADDLGIVDTGVYGSKIIDTPNIDALASSGVRFTQGYVSHHVCSPSRAGLLTGRYQQRHGWEFNQAGRDTDEGLALDQATIADELRERGYATGMIGKWHLGGDFLIPGQTEFYRGPKNGDLTGKVDLTRWISGGPKDCGFDYDFTSPCGIQGPLYLLYEKEN